MINESGILNDLVKDKVITGYSFNNINKFGQLIDTTKAMKLSSHPGLLEEKRQRITLFFSSGKSVSIESVAYDEHKNSALIIGEIK